MDTNEGNLQRLNIIYSPSVPERPLGHGPESDALGFLSDLRRPASANQKVETAGLLSDSYDQSRNFADSGILDCTKAHIRRRWLVHDHRYRWLL